MHKPKKRTPTKKKVDWVDFLDDCQPGLVIPVGSRFQVVVPEWKDPPEEASSSEDKDTLRYLGTRIWPRDAQQNNNILKDKCKIGDGRPDSCNCSTPGSLQCVKLHMSEARRKLQSDLGPAYKIWKFDEMGEDVGKSWSSKQKNKFSELVKTNPLSEGKSFLMPAVEAFPSKTRKAVVSYYLNVHVPKRIGMLTRSGCKMVDSDDDEVVEAPTAVNNSLKRSRPNNVDITELVKSHYLTGRR